MDYKDLFIEKYDKIVLMIFFDDYPYEWYLGKPFLRKYSFLIQQDSNIVGFYKRDAKLFIVNEWKQCFQKMK